MIGKKEHEGECADEQSDGGASDVAHGNEGGLNGDFAAHSGGRELLGFEGAATLGLTHAAQTVVVGGGLLVFVIDILCQSLDVVLLTLLQPVGVERHAGHGGEGIAEEEHHEDKCGHVANGQVLHTQRYEHGVGDEQASIVDDRHQGHVVETALRLVLEIEVNVGHE